MTHHKSPSTHNASHVTHHVLFICTGNTRILHQLAHLTGWCLVALIIYGSLTTTPVTQDMSINDKSQHFLAYFITMRGGVYWKTVPDALLYHFISRNDAVHQDLARHGD